ncbi:MAG: hypothetical protein ACRD4R_16270 [Candidatus Acidiferrales bacterium]
MPKIRIIEYEGSDDGILKLLAQGGISAQTAPATAAAASGNGHSVNPTVWDAVAKKFHRHISDTAAYGRTGQSKAMQAWLQRGGEIELTTLWRSAGVKNQHDFGGVGGSLTKNMQKAGGPREWYRCHRNDKNQWIYKIIDELVEPLQQAFAVK